MTEGEELLEFMENIFEWQDLDVRPKLPSELMALKITFFDVPLKVDGGNILI
jgi:hypothetical protein